LTRSLGTEFLGEVPLDLQIRETSDDGHPITFSDPDNPHSLVFRAIAARIWEKNRRRPTPQAAPHPASSSNSRGTIEAPPRPSALKDA
jgi:nitrogenase subunit NifH